MSLGSVPIFVARNADPTYVFDTFCAMGGMSEGVGGPVVGRPVG